MMLNTDFQPVNPRPLRTNTIGGKPIINLKMNIPIRQTTLTSEHGLSNIFRRSYWSAIFSATYAAVTVALCKTVGNKTKMVKNRIPLSEDKMI